MYRNFELEAAIAKALKALNGVDKYTTDINYRNGAAYIKCEAAENMMTIEFVTKGYPKGNASAGLILSRSEPLEIEVRVGVSKDVPVTFKCHAIQVIASGDPELSELMDGLIELGRALACVKERREVLKIISDLR